jgi:hypothetical protein
MYEILARRKIARSYTTMSSYIGILPYPNGSLRHFSMLCVSLDVHAIGSFHQPLVAGWQSALAL